MSRSVTKAKADLPVVRDDDGEILAEIGTGNVWADLGARDPLRETAKAQLVLEIEHIMKRRGLTQARAGQIIGLPQPKLSMLLRGHWKSYSLDRLTRFVTKLGADVRISFKEHPDWHEGRVVVAST